MGKNQSKEENKDQIVIAQSGANYSSIETQLSQFNIVISVIVVILIIIMAYFLYKRCHKSSKRWVHRQVLAITPQAVQSVQGTTSIPMPVTSNSTPPKVKIVSI